MLSTFDSLLGITGTALQVVIAVILVRRSLWRTQFPFFFLYVCYSIVNVVGLLAVSALSSSRTYARVYWMAQPLYAILGVMAMNESFRTVFRVYYFRRSWFRFLLPAVVLAILSVSTWKWLRHSPIQAGPLTVAYISFDLAMNYMLAGIFAVFGVLVFFWRPKWQRYPYAILIGFGVFSIVGMLADALRSDFGTKMNFIFSYAAAMAYIVACVIWLRAFMRDHEELKDRSAPPVDPNELLRLLTRHSNAHDKRESE